MTGEGTDAKGRRFSEVDVMEKQEEAVAVNLVGDVRELAVG